MEYQHEAYWIKKKFQAQEEDNMIVVTTKVTGSSLKSNDWVYQIRYLILI